MRTGFVLFDDFEELDFAGPWEVLGVARREGDEIVSIAATTEPVRAANGMQVVPDHTFEDCPDLDVVLVPGGMGTRQEGNERLVRWLVERAPRARWLTSVCTGAYLLHAAGLLEGKRVTTHWAFVDDLRAKGVEVIGEERWVVDDNVVTAAGVSAGIDMALWLVGEIYGADHAREVRRVMEYDPAPPY